MLTLCFIAVRQDICPLNFSGQFVRRQTRDHAVQGIGRNQPERIRAIHRQGNAAEQSRIRAARRVRPDLQLLHGQEHAGAEGLHHGQAGRAGGGVTMTKCAASGQRCTPNLRRVNS
jgi:hypothetical protein